MRQKVADILRAKGIANADAVLNELECAGILTHYDLCKYIAQEEYFKRAVKYPNRSNRDLIHDIADELQLSPATVRRALV